LNTGGDNNDNNEMYFESKICKTADHQTHATYQHLFAAIEAASSAKRERLKLMAGKAFIVVGRFVILSVIVISVNVIFHSASICLVQGGLERKEKKYWRKVISLFDS
jgi:hypothetical protein